MINWRPRIYRTRRKEIIAESIIHGASPTELARKHGVSMTTVQRVLREAPSANDVGVVPEDKRRGCWRPFIAIVEPILIKRGITWAQFFGRAQTTRIAFVRYEAWSALRDAGRSLPEIGEFSSRDHTTILHGVRHWRAMEGE